MAELVPDEESRMRRRRRRGASWIRRSARSFWHAAPCCPKKTRARRRHARQMGSDRAIGATPTARFSPGGLLERQGLAFEREFAHGKRELGRREIGRASCRERGQVGAVVVGVIENEGHGNRG